MIEHIAVGPRPTRYELRDKINSLIEAVNELIQREQRRNRASHKNIVKVGEGELAFCEDCKGGEIDLWEASCDERRILETGR